MGEMPNPEDGWQPARLIPTSGIKGADEQEKRATSALLSVMTAVPEFSRELLRRAGAPAGRLRGYIEPEFARENGQKLRPDGALVVRRGSTCWRALVEVKTGVNELARDQIESYLDLAREGGINAVITISNQLATAADAHPLAVGRRLTRKVDLYHWSWVEILTAAVIQREHRGISDPDQAWILGELIAYLKHPQSGAMQFQDMGPSWVTVREGARDGMLRPQDPGVSEVVLKWDQFIQYLCLHLAGDLGVEVVQILPRLEQADPNVRRQNLIRQLVQSRNLSGVIRVKNAIGPLTLVAALEARTTTVSVSVDAPSEGRPITRVNWLLRQLDGASPHLRISASFAGVRDGNTGKLGDLRENSAALLLADKSRAPRTFTLSLMREMGTKRGGVKGSFIGEATDLVLSFYREVVQGMRPWAAPPPKLPSQRQLDDIAEQPENVVSQAALAEAEKRAPEPTDPSLMAIPSLPTETSEA